MYRNSQCVKVIYNIQHTTSPCVTPNYNIQHTTFDCSFLYFHLAVFLFRIKVCYYPSNTANFKENYLLTFLLKLVTFVGFSPSSSQDKIKVYSNVLSLLDFHTFTSLPGFLRVTIQRYNCYQY
jgi:hypothetical protein